MADDAHMHLVEFDMYCPSCKHVKVKQEDEPNPPDPEGFLCAYNPCYDINA